jgi:hypothetical protein
MLPALIGPEKVVVPIVLLLVFLSAYAVNRFMLI